MLHRLKWFFDNLSTILVGVGTVSVLLRSWDAVLKRLLAKHPDSGALKRADAILNGSDAALGWIGDTLDKVAFNRDKVYREHGA